MAIKVVQEVYQWLQEAGIKNEPVTKDRGLAIVGHIRDFLETELKEIEDGFRNNDPAEIINGCVDVLWVVSNLPYMIGISLEGLEAECVRVRKSNNTKFCKSDLEATTSLKAYAEGTHPNKKGEQITGLTIHPTGNDKFPYVLKRGDKIMKSVEFKDVDKF